jgi:hypothetical protein
VKRFLCNLAAAASALLAVATVGLWVRSHFIADRIAGTTAARRHVDVISCKGTGDVRVARPYPYHTPFQWEQSETYFPRRDPWYALGFDFERGSVAFAPLHTGPPDFPPAPYWNARVPDWFPLALFAAYPAHRARRALRRRRERLLRERGVCLCCGYDLRATTGRCPECGTAFAPPVTAS